MYKTMNSSGAMFLWLNRPKLIVHDFDDKEWKGEEPFRFLGEALSKNCYTKPTIEEVYVSSNIETKYLEFHPILE